MNVVVRPATVLVAGVEFGWGSAGKLSAVLSALRDRATRPLRFVLLGSKLGRPLLAEHHIDRYYEIASAHQREINRIVQAEHADAGLVVLDPALANSLEAAGVPTVFVDSLPFLWAEGDLPGFPLTVSAYCAQRCWELPEESRAVLGWVRNLRWVDAVIDAPANTATSSPRRVFHRVLVNLGGLHAPQVVDWTAYPRLVIPPLLSALQELGAREVYLAGNLHAWLADELVADAGSDMTITTGALGHAEFLRWLDRADVLLTSPGLTTLLEASSRGVPTVCLPPQNLSQIFNGRFYARAAGRDVRVTWPTDVFVEWRALTSRAGGEPAALKIIYGGIARAAANCSAIAPVLRDRIAETLRFATLGADWAGLARMVGTRGAAQVADCVLDLLETSFYTTRGPEREVS
jgi:hydroxymethylcytosylglucuronate/cytosylglucuronate synthase